MPRGRGSDRPLIVELVPDDEDGVGAHATPHPASSPDGTSARKDPAADPAAGAPGRGARFRAWLARQPRTRLVVAGVAALALVAGAGVAATVADQRRVERLRALPGGVVDLASPPRTAWTYETDNPVWPVAQLGPLLVVAEQEEDPALFGPGPAESEEVTLRALDPASGEERWNRGIGTALACAGGMAGFGTSGPEPVDQLVCLVPGGDGWSALVLDGDGALVAERPLPGVDGPIGVAVEGGLPGSVVATPTSDGGVLRLARVGEPPEMPELVDQGAGEWRAEARVPARDVRVTLEDAVSGRERWSATLPADPADDWSSCASWPADGESSSPVLTDTTVWANATAGLVLVQGCGVAAELTADGVRLDDGAAWAETSVAAGELYAVPPRGAEPGSSSSGRTTMWTLVRSDGTRAGELPGPPATPAVADGTGPELLFAQEDGGLVALRSDDLARAWQAEAGSGGGVLAQVEGTVLTVARGDLVGLDAATGERRWVTDLDAATQDALATSGGGLGLAFTDGRRVVVHVPSWSSQDGVGQWTAYDVGTGEVVWSLPLGEARAWVVAVDGHLVSAGTDRIEGLG